MGIRKTATGQVWIIVVVILGLGLVGAFGYPYLKSKLLLTPALKCCLECQKQVNSENIKITDEKKQKTCKDSKELGDECRKYFADNQEADKVCANSTLSEIAPKVSLIDIPKSNPKYTAKLAELKTKYGSLVWKGTIKGSVETSIEPAGWYGTSSYTIEIKEMKIDFDHPDMKEPVFSNLNQEDQRWPITGKLTYHMAPFKCVVCCNKISDPFIPSVITKTLEGQISFGENQLDFDFYVPEGEAVMLDTKCKDPTCDPDSIIPQQLDLGNLVDTSLKVRFEGNKIVILGCEAPNNKNYKCTAGGSLDINK